MALGSYFEGARSGWRRFRSSATLVGSHPGLRGTGVDPTVDPLLPRGVVNRHPTDTRGTVRGPCARLVSGPTGSGKGSGTTRAQRVTTPLRVQDTGAPVLPLRRGPLGLRTGRSRRTWELGFGSFQSASGSGLVRSVSTLRPPGPRSFRPYLGSRVAGRVGGDATETEGYRETERG